MMEWRTCIGPGLAAITFALAFNYVGTTSNGALVLASVLLLGGCCHKLFSSIHSGEIRWGSPLTVASGYVGLLVVLGYNSMPPDNSLHYGWLLASFAFVLFLTTGFSEALWRRTFSWFVLTGCISAVWGIAEFLSTSTRANGPIIDPSSFGSVNNLFCLAALSMFLTAPERRWRWLAAIALFSFASFCAYSRVGTTVLLLAFAFVSLIIIVSKPALKSRVAIAVVTVMITFTLVNTYSSLEQASEHSEGYTLDVQSYGWSQRLAMWKSAVAIYRDNPLLGTGLGTFKAHYAAYRGETELNNLGNFAHNDYLQFLVEGGPLLLAFLLSLVAVLAFGLARNCYRLIKGDSQYLEACVLAVAMGTILVQALMNFPLYQMQVQLLMALLFARYIEVSGFIAPTRFVLARKSLVRALVVLGFIGLLVPLVLDEASNKLVFGAGEKSLTGRLNADARSITNTMSALAAARPGNPTNRFAMATIYRSVRDGAPEAAGSESLAIAAALEYEAGLKLSPWHSNVRSYLADFLEQNPWLMQVEGIESTPETLHREGARLSPVHIQSWMSLAFFLERQGRHDEAYDLLVHNGLPVMNVRHGEYYNERLGFAKEILRRAVARNDRATLLALEENF